jgi:hypothetical protein
MRITEDRYSQHRRSLDLAWRLIKHEARTRTISRWTQLSGHRIRLLYKSYSSKQQKRVTRHRGMSPYKLEMILNSPRLRCEGAMFSAICRSLQVLPPGRLNDPERVLPGVERGERLCEAFEWFRFDVPDTKITIEHGLLLINELARGELIHLGACRTCRGVVLLDRLSTGRLQCVFCSTKVETVERISAVDADAECPSRSPTPFPSVQTRELEAGGSYHVHPGPAESMPYQLSWLDEREAVAGGCHSNLTDWAQRTHGRGTTSEIAVRQSTDDHGPCFTLSLFDKLKERGGDAGANQVRGGGTSKPSR